MVALLIIITGSMNCASSPHSFKPMAERADLEVVVSGVQNEGGYIYLYLYDREETFLGRKKETIRLYRKTVRPYTRFIIRGKIKGGRYALMAYHDVNDNGRLDRKQGTDIPHEGVGMSKGAAYPSTWNRSVFSVDSTNKRIEIKLKYPEEPKFHGAP